MIHELTHLEPYDYFVATITAEYGYPSNSWRTVPFSSCSINKRGKYNTSTYCWTPQAGLVVVQLHIGALWNTSSYHLAIATTQGSVFLCRSIGREENGPWANGVATGFDITDGSKSYYPQVYCDLGGDRYVQTTGTRYLGWLFKI